MLKTARDMNDEGFPRRELLVICRDNQTVTLRLNALLGADLYAYN